MTRYFYLALILIIIMISSVIANKINSTELDVKIDGRIQLIEMATRQLKHFWVNYLFVPKDNTFVGRCLGIAKKIRQLMPIFIFKMGAIMTILAFLTIFSMKSVGLLILLLIINVGGSVAKITAALTQKKEEHGKKPQNIHLHFHQTKHGYHLENSGYEWEEKVDSSYNLYDKLSKNPYLKRDFR